MPSGLDVTCKRGEKALFCEEAAGQQPSSFSFHGVVGGLGKNHGKNKKEDINEPTSAPNLASLSSRSASNIRRNSPPADSSEHLG